MPAIGIGVIQSLVDLETGDPAVIAKRAEELGRGHAPMLCREPGIRRGRLGRFGEKRRGLLAEIGEHERLAEHADRRVPPGRLRQRPGDEKDRRGIPGGPEPFDERIHGPLRLLG